MRYVHKNNDGSIGVWASIPYAAIINGQQVGVFGVRRKAGQCLLYGEFGEVAVGPEDFDVSDMPADYMGVQWVFPTFEEIKAKLHPDYAAKVVSHRTMKRDELIEDRTFRGAWRDSGKLEIDMPEARKIQRDRIRNARAPLLESLDIAYQRADENGDNARKRDVAAKKQALRDFTKDPRIDAAQTPEELKEILPDANNYL
jgi:hypothetical protein